MRGLIVKKIALIPADCLCRWTYWLSSDWPLEERAAARVKNAVDLDYGRVNFGLSVQSKILLFEANSTIIVQQPDKASSGLIGVRGCVEIADGMTVSLA